MVSPVRQGPVSGLQKLVLVDFFPLTCWKVCLDVCGCHSLPRTDKFYQGVCKLYPVDEAQPFAEEGFVLSRVMLFIICNRSQSNAPSSALRSVASLVQITTVMVYYSCTLIPYGSFDLLPTFKQYYNPFIILSLSELFCRNQGKPVFLKIHGSYSPLLWQ